MFQSSSIRSTSGSRWISSSASTPFSASTTSIPISRRMFPTMIRTVRESSTTSARMMVPRKCIPRAPREATPARLILELPHQLLQLHRHSRQLIGRTLGVAGPLRRTPGRLRDAANALGDFTAAPRRLSNVPADLAGRGGLLLDGAGDGVLDIVDLVDDLADLGDRFDRALRVSLNGLDLAADVLGGLGGLLGQLLDLVGD